MQWYLQFYIRKILIIAPDDAEVLGIGVAVHRCGDGLLNKLPRCV